MTVYLCLDDRNGLQFNKRRQSRDRAVLRDMAAQAQGALTIEAFSEALLAEAGIRYTLATELPAEGHFFCETKTAERLLPLAKTLVIYRWNRHYPADVRLAAPETWGFSLGEKTEFPGSSHERITKEVYVK